MAMRGIAMCSPTSGIWNTRLPEIFVVPKIQCESSCHAAVQPENALRSVWRKHDDTNFLFSFSQSTFD
jgi:hypothetical protein